MGRGRKVKVGDTYGEWTVMRMVYDRGVLKAECKCSCGTVRTVRPASLANGDSCSCGSCLSKRTYSSPGPTRVGMIIGGLEVVEVLGKDAGGYKLVRCRCLCGSSDVIEASTHKLRRRRFPTCGKCELNGTIFLPASDDNPGLRLTYAQQRVLRLLDVSQGKVEVVYDPSSKV